MGKIQAAVVDEYLACIRRFGSALRSLPMESLEAFQEQAHIPAAAESYLRRSAEALLELARHILSRGFQRAPVVYKAVAYNLYEAGVIEKEEIEILERVGAFRNRMFLRICSDENEILYRECSENIEAIERLAGSIETWVQVHPDQVISGE